MQIIILLMLCDQINYFVWIKMEIWQFALNRLGELFYMFLGFLFKTFDSDLFRLWTLLCLRSHECKGKWRNIYIFEFLDLNVTESKFLDFKVQVSLMHEQDRRIFVTRLW